MKAPSFAPRLLFFFFLAAISLSAAPALAQTGAEAIVGVWKTQDGDAHIQVFKGSNGKYYGKIAWLEIPNTESGSPRLDINNPDEAKRKNPLMGTMILSNFDYSASAKEYNNGFVYDSKSGSTYSGYLKLQADGTLFMKGYIMGMRWMGRSNVWTRVK